MGTPEVLHNVGCIINDPHYGMEYLYPTWIFPFLDIGHCLDGVQATQYTHHTQIPEYLQRICYLRRVREEHRSN